MFDTAQARAWAEYYQSLCRQLVVALLVALVAYAVTQRVVDQEYSFSTFYATLSATTRATMPECDPPVESTHGMVALCQQSHTMPTHNQIMLWETYQVWVLCHRYNSAYACDDLQN